MSRQILTRFEPERKSAVLRQKNRLVCGSLKIFVFEASPSVLPTYLEILTTQKAFTVFSRYCCFNGRLRWRAFPKFARLWSSRHRFTLRRILWATTQMYTRAFSWNFARNRFSGLCRTWQKRHWLLRKRESMRDRKLVGSRQRSLSSRIILPLLAGNASST